MSADDADLRYLKTVRQTSRDILTHLQQVRQLAEDPQPDSPTWRARLVAHLDQVALACHTGLGEHSRRLDRLDEEVRAALSMYLLACEQLPAALVRRDPELIAGAAAAQDAAGRHLEAACAELHALAPLNGPSTR